MDDRLYRSSTDRVIAGVAGGLAAWLRIDPSIVRIAWVLGAVFSFGIFVLVYVVMMIVVPLQPEGWRPTAAPRATPGGDPVPGWRSGGTGGSGPQTGAPAPQSGPGWSGTGPPWPGPGTTWGNPATPPATGHGSEPARGARVVAGGLLVLLGAWLLVDQYVAIPWAVVWPVLVMGAGVALVVVAIRRRPA